MRGPSDYSGTYGITTSGSALTLKFKTGSNIGSRVYLMASDTQYQLIKLANAGENVVISTGPNGTENKNRVHL